MFKHIKLIIVGLILMTSLSFADSTPENEWDKFETNVEVKFGDIKFGSRSYVDDDENHLIFGYQLFPKLETQYRYVTGLSGQNQHRLRVTHKTFGYGPFFANSVLEYRLKQDEGDDILRIRPKIGAKVPIGGLTLQYDLQPHWDFDNETDTGSQLKLNKYEHTVSAIKKINDNLSLTLFAQMERDKDNNHDETYMGTSIKINFPQLTAIQK